MILPWIVMMVFAFLLGSLPFSIWLGRLALKGKDVRKYGDGNPGATTALRAGGWKLGLAVLMLDITKGALPVGLAYQVFGFTGWQMWCIALAPTLGHVFSPFLGGRGGKGLAVTLGVWIGLSLAKVALPILIILTFWYLILSVDGWAVMFTIASLFVFLYLVMPGSLYLAVLGGQTILLAWTHRDDLRKKPGFHRRVRHLFHKAESK